MTRENKWGLVVAGAFLALTAGVITVKMRDRVPRATEDVEVDRLPPAPAVNITTVKDSQTTLVAKLDNKTHNLELRKLTPPKSEGGGFVTERTNQQSNAKQTVQATASGEPRGLSLPPVSSQGDDGPENHNAAEGKYKPSESMRTDKNIVQTGGVQPETPTAPSPQHAGSSPGGSPLSLPPGGAPPTPSLPPTLPSNAGSHSPEAPGTSGAQKLPPPGGLGGDTMPNLPPSSLNVPTGTAKALGQDNTPPAFARGGHDSSARSIPKVDNPAPGSGSPIPSTPLSGTPLPPPGIDTPTGLSDKQPPMPHNTGEPRRVLPGSNDTKSEAMPPVPPPHGGFGSSPISKDAKDPIIPASKNEPAPPVGVKDNPGESIQGKGGSSGIAPPPVGLGSSPPPLPPAAPATDINKQPAFEKPEFKPVARPANNPEADAPLPGPSNLPPHAPPASSLNSPPNTPPTGGPPAGSVKTGGQAKVWEKSTFTQDPSNTAMNSGSPSVQQASARTNEPSPFAPPEPPPVDKSSSFAAQPKITNGSQTVPKTEPVNVERSQFRGPAKTERRDHTIHEVRVDDTWEKISERYFIHTGCADALREYNRGIGVRLQNNNQPIPRDSVAIPSMAVLQEKHGALLKPMTGGFGVPRETSQTMIPKPIEEPRPLPAQTGSSLQVPTGTPIAGPPGSAPPLPPPVNGGPPSLPGSPPSR